MTLMDKANIDLELQIDLGRGYVPAETNEKYIDVVGTIPIDAVFSPVKKVAFSIENTRVGHRNDYDKLVLDVWTDGTISPENALAEAAKIAKDHFTISSTSTRTVLGAMRTSMRRRSACGRCSTPRRGARAFGPLEQLPEERQHQDDWRSDAKDRG